MKPVYVILLMGAAALGGGLVVHYGERPPDIALGVTMAPKVVAPPVAPHDPIPPDAVPPPAPPPEPAPAVEPTPKTPARREKPSALSHTVHVARSVPVAPPRTGSVHIPLDPPAVVALDIPPDDPHAPVASSGRSEPLITPQVPAASHLTPNHVTLPVGMLITVRIIDRLSSDRNSQGDVFSGSLERPVIADGFVIAERGARVRGEVVYARRAGRVEGVSELTIRLREISTSDGQHVQIVCHDWRKQGPTAAGTDAAKIAGGAALGAIIGAIAGGGKGAGIGAGIGGAAGTGDVLLTRAGPAIIKPETSITFRLERQVEITEQQ